MKKWLSMLLCALLLFAAAAAEETNEITVETVTDTANVLTILDEYGAIKVDYTNEGFTETRVYLKTGESLIASDTYTLTETGDVASTCVVGDDLAYYYLDPSGVTRNMLTEENVQEFFAGSLINLTDKEYTMTEEESVYRFLVTIDSGTVNIALDKETLLPVEMSQLLYEGTEEEFLLSVAYSYGEGIEADMSSVEAYAALAEQTAEGLPFVTEDLDGNTVMLADFKDASIIMVNLFEPWCGPCVSEMPELEQLYQKYKGEGFVLIGAFSETDMDDDVRIVLEDTGVTYPIVRTDSILNTMQSGYVPTTFFMDAQGNLLTEEPYVGSKSLEEWEEILLEVWGK